MPQTHHHQTHVKPRRLLSTKHLGAAAVSVAVGFGVGEAAPAALGFNPNNPHIDEPGGTLWHYCGWTGRIFPPGNGCHSSATFISNTGHAESGGDLCIQEHNSAGGQTDAPGCRGSGLSITHTDLWAPYYNYDYGWVQGWNAGQHSKRLDIWYDSPCASVCG